VNDSVPALLQVCGILLVRAEAIKTGGDESLGIARLQLVPCQLLLDEAVEGQVLVQSLDYIITILIGKWPQIVGFEAVGLRVTHEIEPVLRPALAVLWRGKQPIDRAAIRLGRLVRKKSLLLRDCGRQAGQIEAGSSQERELLGAGGGSQSFGFELFH